MTDAVATPTGASSGTGRAAAIRLTDDFSNVVLVARGQQGLGGTASEVRRKGAELLVLEHDLSAPTAAEQVASETLGRCGRIDAGAVLGIDLFEMTDDEWIAGADLKLHGARRLTRRAWEAPKASRGAVIFTSGAAADTPTAAAAAVEVFNAAIDALSEAFSDRGITDGIQVKTVSPGAVITRRRLSMVGEFAEINAVSFEEANAKVIAAAKIERFGEPKENADAMAFLVAPQSRRLTGTCLRVDGGEVKSI